MYRHPLAFLQRVSFKLTFKWFWTPSNTELETLKNTLELFRNNTSCKDKIKSQGKENEYKFQLIFTYLSLKLNHVEEIHEAVGKSQVTSIQILVPLSHMYC